MQTETKIYIDTLCSQIRWKKARHLVREELKGHIEESIQEGESKGMSKEKAERKAAETMGDPVEVGRMMDKLHRPKTDILMIISIAVLMLFGLAILSAAVYPFNINIGTLLFSVRWEWLTFRAVGIALFLICLFVNFRWLLKKNVFIIASGAIGIAGLLFMNLTSAHHGFWKIHNESLTFISYICICLLVISFAGLLSRFQRKDGIMAIAAAGIAIAAACLMLFRENAPRILAMFLLASFTVMFWFTKIKILWKVIISVVIFSLVFIYLLINGYFDALFNYPDRIGAFFDDGEIVILKERLLNVQIIGQAPGAPEMFMNSLYLASTNIMVYVLLKFGILPAALLAAALGVLIWRMISACIRIRDIQGRVLATGLAAFITITIIGTLLLNFLFIGTSRTYMPFLQGIGPEFVLYSVFLGLIAGMYRRKDLYTAKNTVQRDSSTLTDTETA